MTEQFFSELVIPGCIIQLGAPKTVMAAFQNPSHEDIVSFLARYGESNDLFFLGGVKDDGKLHLNRAADDDILKKNYFYLDFDIRKSHPELTDEKIKTEIIDWVKETLADLEAPYSDWRYIVFTGNGLHVYYFGDAIEITDKTAWRLGISDFITKVEVAFGEKFDRACVNPARIARMPGSFNCKGKPKKHVDIIAHQDSRISLSAIIEGGKKIALAHADEGKKKAEEMRTQFPDDGDAYNAIQQIPIGKIVCMLTGWSLAQDNVHFTEAGKNKSKACFISSEGNFMVHGGTSHWPPNMKGYRPFEAVKFYKGIDNAATYAWFKNAFPEINKLSQQRKMGFVEVANDYGIKSVFNELRTTEVRQLNLGGDWDDWRLLLRGKVTRIGAMPGTGKSKLGYFLTHLLLQKEYRGLFFSTEVSSADVLAHLLQIRMEKPYLDILEHRVEVPPEMEDDYRNLSVYDVRHTGNNLARIEQIIKREYDRAEASNMRGIDFVVVDFSQQVTPKSGRFTDIFTWATEWGNACQEIAQKYGVAFIDVCQLSVKGNKDEDEKYGHVPYEGGNKLLQTADVASMLSRDKAIGSLDNSATWDIRKSKSMGRRFRLTLGYNWNTGRFSLDSAWDSREEILPINYKAIREGKAIF